jgi:hypothetical protein
MTSSILQSDVVVKMLLKPVTDQYSIFRIPAVKLELPGTKSTAFVTKPNLIRQRQE